MPSSSPEWSGLLLVCAVVQRYLVDFNPFDSSVVDSESVAHSITDARFAPDLPFAVVQAKDLTPEQSQHNFDGFLYRQKRDSKCLQFLLLFKASASQTLSLASSRMPCKCCTFASWQFLDWLSVHAIVTLPSINALAHITCSTSCTPHHLLRNPE